MAKPGSLANNIVYNFAGVGVPFLVTVVTVPFYLKAIGDARFGILSLIWLLFGYFGLFDFGLSRATANRLAQLRDGDPRERSAVFYTAIVMNALLGTLAGAAFYFAAQPLLIYLLGSASSLATEIPNALPMMAAMFPLAMVGGVFLGSLEAEERFLTINIQQIVGTVLLQCLPLAMVLKFGPQIEIAVIGTVAARLIIVIWSGAAALQSLNFARLPEIRLDLVRSLLKYGGWVAITNLIAPLLVSLDRFFIGSMLGASAVAYYSVPFSLAMKVSIVPGAVTRAMFPRLSSMNREAATALADRVCTTLAGVLALVCVPAIILSNIGLSLWIGPEFASAAGSVTRILIVGAWVNGIAYVPFALLQAQGRPDIVAKFHALEIVPFIALLWGCIALLGLKGAALAWVIRVTIDTALLFLASGSALDRAKGALPAASVVISAWIYVTLFEPTPVWAVLIAVVLSGCMFSYIVATDPTLRVAISRRIGMLRKTKVS
jgi:O-antigen/teichoic acid export membrane protein